ncbi:LysR family transcriptional regulator [Aeromicrobium sp. CTD01-1L150]|uniref:LysR family transcriptional regulator n=1 Tax=Aeromicrobium sp. CTD01-1L150 TaxID=3341830 RepID=UPI0035C254D9
MEIRDLETLVALADELHFGRAAARLQMTQPPLTKRLQKVERSLGVRLFERDRHGVRLTHEGTDVVAMARAALQEVHRLERHASELRAGTSGTIHIAAVGSAFYAALPRLLEPARRSHPGMKFRAFEFETTELVDALRSGEVDVGFVRPPVGRDLATREVWTEPLVAAVGSNHPLADHSVVSAEQLAGSPFVFFHRDAGPGYWDRAADVLASAGAPLEPQVVTDHVSTILGMVALGEGVTLVPASARAYQHPEIRYITLDQTVELPLSVATIREQPRAIVRTFLETLPRTALTFG